MLAEADVFFAIYRGKGMETEGLTHHQRLGTPDLVCFSVGALLLRLGDPVELCVDAEQLFLGHLHIHHAAHHGRNQLLTFCGLQHGAHLVIEGQVTFGHIDVKPVDDCAIFYQTITSEHICSRTIRSAFMILAAYDEIIHHISIVVTQTGSWNFELN